MIILGIDPGTSRLGYGLIKEEKNKAEFLDAGILKIRTKDACAALLEIKKGLDGLIKKWRPDLLAIEKLYFSKNQTTAMAVGQARGVAILAGLEKGLVIFECSPNEVKAGLSGYGFADKKGMAKIVNLTLNVPKLKLIDDASDALAIALFAARSKKF